MIHAAQASCFSKMGYHVFAKCVYGLGLSVIFLSNLGSAAVLKNVRSKDVANIHRCHFITACAMVKKLQAADAYCAYLSNEGDITCVPHNDADNTYPSLDTAGNCVKLVETATEEKDQDEFLSVISDDIESLNLECPMKKKSAAVSQYSHANMAMGTIVGSAMLLAM